MPKKTNRARNKPSQRSIRTRSRKKRSATQAARDILRLKTWAREADCAARHGMPIIVIGGGVR